MPFLVTWKKENTFLFRFVSAKVSIQEYYRTAAQTGVGSWSLSQSIKKAKCKPHDLINHTSLALIGAVTRAWSRNYKVAILEIILATIDVLFAYVLFRRGMSADEVRCIMVSTIVH